MRRELLLSLVFTGASLFIPARSLVFAQAPGGAQGNPSMQTPRQTSPDMTRPGAATPQTLPSETMQSKVDDKKFLKDAAIGGMTEVELGKLATQKASSDAVKQFGQKMVDDHSKANDELKQVATQEGVTVPDSLDAKQQARVDKLSKLSGADFDKAYVKDQLKDHRKDVSEFKREADNGSNANIKNFAAKTLPVLEEHLSIVKNLNKNAKATSMK